MCAFFHIIRYILKRQGSEEMAILTIKDLDFSYHSPQGETKALTDINLTVNEGEFISIVGPSGCGKSTLLSIIAGLTPVTGGFFVNNATIGYMLQRDHLFEWRTIYDNVILGLEIKKILTHENIERVNRLLERYGLEAFKDKRPSELSGGMRQRAALIRTLALNPDILLLDEPFSALDYQTRLRVSDDIGEIIKEEKKTALLVTHDLSEAIAMGDRIVVLSERPGTIKKIIDIDFGSLSPLERRNAPEFQEYFHELWRCFSKKEKRRKTGLVKRKLNVSEEQQIYLDGIRREKIKVNCVRVFILVAFIALWEGCARLGVINDFIFSSPSRIVKCFVSMCMDGSLLRHIWVTLYETFISFFLVIGIGLAAAVLMWLSRSFSKIIEPYIVVLNSLPKSALAPILIVWLGNNIRTIIISAISVAVFGTILTLYTGFMEMDPDKIKLIKTLGGNRFHVLTKVLIPGNLAVILNTMKVNMGLSLVGVIIGEFLAANEGLGYLIIYGSQVFKLDWVMLSIIILCIMATVLYQLINILERVLAKKYI